MHTRIRVTRALVLPLALSLALACGQSPVVTVKGTPVTNEAFVAATLRVHQAEVVSVAIGEFLLTRHQQACHALTVEAQRVQVACVQATGWLRTYATQYAPEILKGLLAARDVLRIVATAPATTSQEKVETPLTLLTAALSQATQWAVGHGWTPTPLTP